jgi:hypothetical protein
VRTDGRTYRQTNTTKLIIAFRNVSNAPKTCKILEVIHDKLFKNLRRDWKETNRSIRGDVIDGLARFWYHYDLCEFPQEWVIRETEHTITYVSNKYFIKF